MPVTFFRFKGSCVGKATVPFWCWIPILAGKCKASGAIKMVDVDQADRMLDMALSVGGKKNSVQSCEASGGALA